MVPQELPSIVWDVDDVLSDLMRSWFERCWLKAHPECQLQYGDIVENPPHRILNIELEHYLASLDEFRLSGEYQKLTPDIEIQQWFEKYGNGFRHMALTATPLRSAAISAAWVISHFGRWIRCFSFIPAARPGEKLAVYDRTKGEFLSWWGKADILIDDSAANTEAASSMGIEAILIQQPWNSSQITVRQALDQLTLRQR